MCSNMIRVPFRNGGGPLRFLLGKVMVNDWSFGTPHFNACRGDECQHVLCTGRNVAKPTKHTTSATSSRTMIRGGIRTISGQQWPKVFSSAWWSERKLVSLWPVASEQSFVLALVQQRLHSARCVLKLKQTHGSHILRHPFYNIPSVDSTVLPSDHST